jgi:TRAP-type C4-dicarboxylate transport system permease small subunit
LLWEGGLASVDASLPQQNRQARPNHTSGMEMKRALRVVQKIYNGILNLAAYLAMSLTVLMMLCIVASVFLRRTEYAFGWALEASEYILIIMTFFGTGWLLGTGGHIRVDIVPNYLKGRSRDFYNGMIFSVVATVCLVLTIAGISTAWEAFVAGTLQIKVYTFPKWILISLLPFGGFFLFIESVRLAYGYFARKTVLIVDDEPDIVDTLQELIKDYRVHTTFDFDSASKKLKTNHYDAVVLDIMGVSGFDLLRMCAEKQVPAIMLTAHAFNPAALKKAMQMGAISYLPKEEMVNINLFLQDAITLSEEAARMNFYMKLGNYFDRVFGPGWDRNETFWDEARRVFMEGTVETPTA